MPDNKELRKNPLFKKICSEAAKAAARFNMLEPGDRILVGVSGGEDSLTLMHVLDNLRKRTPFEFSIFAVTVDMDFTSFNIGALRDYCLAQNWNWECVTLPGQKLLLEKNAEDRPCALCSRLRRGQLHAAADRLSCNKIALGQHLDDLCASMLMSLFRGGGLKTMGPNVAADAGSKRLIRPFCTMEKSLIHRLALIMDYPFIRSCPYEDKLKEDGDRAYLEALLDKLSLHFGDVRHAMLKSMGDVRLGHLLDPRYLEKSGDPDSGKL